MKITERQLGEFFPRDMRFTHYVAKINGFRFKNDEAVERANFHAMQRILKLYQEEREFDSKEELYGFVISTFRYAILNSFRKTAADKLETYSESQLTYGEGNDEYSVYRSTAVAENTEYDDTASKMLEIMKKHLTWREYRVFELKNLYEYTTSQIALDIEVSEADVLRIRRRIQKKITEIKNKIDEDGINSHKLQIAKEKNKSIDSARLQADIRLQKQIRDRRIKEHEKMGLRSASAMSWLDLNP